MPETLKIGGIVHEVIYPFKFDMDTDLGLYCFSEASIKIAKYYRDKERAKFNIHQTLFMK